MPRKPHPMTLRDKKFLKTTMSNNSKSNSSSNSNKLMVKRAHQNKLRYFFR